MAHKNLLRICSTLLILSVFQIESFAQLVGGNSFIKATSLEIGISGAGGFEGAPWNTVTPPVAGMHYRSGNPYFGFVSNPQVNAWATFDGDFFTPGTPENGWGYRIGSAGVMGSNNCASPVNIPGSITSWSHTFNCYSSDWEGTTSAGDLHWKINYFLQQTDLFYTTTVSVTNLTGANIPDLYYYRNVDPDNDESIGFDFTTTNTVVAEPTSGPCNLAHVKATSVIPAGQPMSYMGFAATGATWRVGHGGFSNRDAYAMWTGTGFVQTVGTSTFADEAIYIANHIINLAPGATQTFKFVVILDDLAAAQAVANTTVLTYPGSLTAPPAVCTPWADTVKICAGTSAPIGVSGPNIASYTWTWAPTTGLTPATGPSVSASPATTTSYTVTGTPINACFAAVTFPFVVQVTPSPTVVPEPNVTVCAGSIVPVNTFTSVPAGATFAWTNSNAAIGLATSGVTSLPAFTATNASGAPITSTITVTPTIPGSACPGIPSTFTITVNPNPVTTVNSPTICPGQTAALVAGGGATSYTWTAGATSTGVNTANASPVVTTTYTVTGTTAGCTSTAVSTVTIGGSIATTVNSPTICAGQTANLVGAGATSYTWTAGATSTGVNTATATPAVTTTYTVTGTSGGCTGTAVATVTVNPVPVTTVTSPTVCNGVTATMTAGGATSYTWTAGATSTGVTTATATPATTTTYTVTGTSLGCTSTAVSTVTVNPIPVTTVNSPTICPASTANLTAGGATSYTWTAGATSTGVTTATATPATTTTYTVTGTSLGCTSTAVSTVTVNAALAVTATSGTICTGATDIITAGGATTYTWSAGATSTGVNTASATPATTTSYTVTGTTAGCTGTAVATVTVNPVPVTTVTSPTVCNGVTATMTAGGATSYTWTAGATSTGVTTATATPAATTTYTVTGTSLGCTSTAVATVTVNPIPVTTVNSPTICPASTANLTAGGATSYTWSAGATSTGVNTATASPAATTTYTVTGTSLGCTSTAVSTVTVAAALVVTVNSPTICNGATASLTAGGATTYTWTAGATSTGVTTADATPATTTTYTVTGTTAGCTGTAVATVTVNPLPVTTVTSPTVCNGVTATMTAGGATSYTWTAGATSTGVTTADATPAATTSYTVTGTSLGCTSTAVATVTVNPIPVTTVNSPAICPASTANLTAGGATTYTWTAGATSTGVNTATATPAATTTYTVTGTSLGCTSTAVSTVTVNAALVVNAGLNDSVCFGMSTTLGVTPNGVGYLYNWTPAASLAGATTAAPVASPAATTTYSVTVTDPSGCTGTSTVTVFADPQITMAIAGINVTCNGACNGQTIVIPAGGTPAYAYLWNTGCTGASCAGLCPNSYTVTVTDSWGCTATASTSVTEPTLLTATTTAFTPASCNGVCDGSATAAAAGGTVGAGYSYSWNTVPVQASSTANGLCAGTYICTATDANGCTATTSVTITEPTLVVTAPIASVTICNGGSATLTASASGGNPGGYAYNWLPAGTGATASVTVSPLVTTTYTVNATDVLHGCPAAPVTVTVTVNPPLAVLTAGTASICPGASTVISAAGSMGNGGPYTYTWAPAGTPAGSPVTVSPAATTTYTVTANDGCSPPVTATVTVTVLPLPVVNFTADNLSGCEPLCVTFTDNSTVAGGTIATWAWTFDGTTSSSAAPSHCFSTPGSYTVGLTVTSSMGGCSSSATNTNMITVFPNPVAAFTAPLSTSIIDPIVPFTDNSTNAATWHWNFGDPLASADSISNLQNPVHNYSLEGTYCVTLAVSTVNGCVDTAHLCVVIDPEFTFFIPNAFSPNGDGINDEFFGKGDYISSFEMDIFDRWGNLIFFSDDINKHWDGKANHGSQMAQQDVYVYVVKITDHKNLKHKYTGTVTIVK